MENDLDDEYVNTNSKLGKLIAKVYHLEKRPNLDNSLSEILDKFLQKLKQSEDYLVNGIFQINFAEAALLLQSSARVYSRKVDLLWDSVNQCQKRMISFKSDENKVELKRLEDREQKYKRKRKIVETVEPKDTRYNDFKNFSLNWNELQEFQHLHFEKDSHLFSNWYNKMVINWDLQPTHSQHSIQSEKLCHFRGIENAIFDKDQDDEFVVYTSKMESVMGLEDLMLQNKTEEFSFKMYMELYLTPKFLTKHQLKYNDLEEHVEEFEKFVSTYKDEYFSNDANETLFKPTSSDLGQSKQKLRRISISSTVASNLSRLDLDKIYVQKCQANDSTEINSIDCFNINKNTEVEEGANNSCTNNLPEFVNKNTEVEEGANNSCTNLPENSGNDADILDRPDDIDLFDNTDDLSQNIPECAGTEEIGEVPENGSDLPHNGECTPEVPVIDSSIVHETRHVQQKVKVKMLRKFEDDEDDNIPEKRRKLSKTALRKLATGITVDLKEFSLFFSAHYQPEEGEGHVEIPEFEIDDPIETSSVIDEDDIPLTQLTQSGICTQDSGFESLVQDKTNLDDSDIGIHAPPTPSATNQISIDPVTSIQEIDESQNREDEDELTEPVIDIPSDPCCSSKENYGRQTEVSETAVPDEEKPLYQRVYEWKQYMSDKFKKMASTDFDIHEYGSSIMEKIDSDRPKKFGDMVKGKSSAEVTRYFISALQLANTCNIEIQGVQSGKLSNETFSLKLVSRERYYDRLKDYIAPSEENFNERLATANQLKKKRAHASTSSGGSNHKRSRFE